MDALYENIALTTRNSLIDQEMQILMKPYAERAEKLCIKNSQDLQLPLDLFHNQARRRVALGLIIP